MTQFKTCHWFASIQLALSGPNSQDLKRQPTHTYTKDWRLTPGLNSTFPLIPTLFSFSSRPLTGRWAREETFDLLSGRTYSKLTEVNQLGWTGHETGTCQLSVPLHLSAQFWNKNTHSFTSDSATGAHTLVTGETDPRWPALSQCSCFSRATEVMRLEQLQNMTHSCRFCVFFFHTRTPVWFYSCPSQQVTEGQCRVSAVPRPHQEPGGSCQFVLVALVVKGLSTQSGVSLSLW